MKRSQRQYLATCIVEARRIGKLGVFEFWYRCFRRAGEDPITAAKRVFRDQMFVERDGIRYRVGGVREAQRRP